jgi:hypothetical protein
MRVVVLDKVCNILDIFYKDQSLGLDLEILSFIVSYSAG